MSKPVIDADQMEKFTLWFRQMAEATLGARDMNEVAQRALDAGLVCPKEPHETPMDWVNDVDDFCTALSDALYSPTNDIYAKDEERHYARC